jgi:hypothetical protein
MQYHHREEYIKGVSYVAPYIDEKRSDLVAVVDEGTSLSAS